MTTTLPVIGLAVGICLTSMVVNALILGQCIKLYTEYFKDRSASRRREAQP